MKLKVPKLESLKVAVPRPLPGKFGSIEYTALVRVPLGTALKLPVLLSSRRIVVRLPFPSDVKRPARVSGPESHEPPSRKAKLPVKPLLVVGMLPLCEIASPRVNAVEFVSMNRRRVPSTI